MVKIQLDLNKIQDKFVTLHKVKTGLKTKAEALRDLIDIEISKEKINGRR